MLGKPQSEEFPFSSTKPQSLKCDMERFSESILKQAKGELGYSFPPIQSQKIARLRRIKRILERDIEEAACLTPVEGGFHVFLRRSDSHQRKNFSCAHEIGHTFFFDLSRRIPTPFETKDIPQETIERLCDIFAESLLMPKEHFLSSWREFERGFGFSGIEKLGRKFKVSLKSIILRAVHLRAMQEKDRFILMFEDKLHSKTGLQKKLRVAIALISQDSDIFVPHNIGVETLGLARLLEMYKDEKLRESWTSEKMETLVRDRVSRHYRRSELTCSAKYKRYGQRYLIGLFKAPEALGRTKVV